MSYRAQAQLFNAQPYQGDHHGDRHDDHDSRQAEPRSYDPHDGRQDRRPDHRQDRQDHRYDHRSQDHAAHYREPAPARPSRAERATQTVKSVPNADYTLGHGRRQVRVGPVAFWTIVGTLVIMACWSVVTATYFAFHDDVLTRLIARQAQMQFAYEDRIADLRLQVDRVTSRQLLDQEQFEQKLDALFRRQQTLETRATAIGSAATADPVTTGSIKPAPRNAPAATDPAGASTPKPAPISDKVIFVAPPDREARLESRVSQLASVTRPTHSARGGLDGVLSRFKDTLDRIETRQAKALETIEESYDAKARRMRSVLADLGIDVTKIAPVKPPAATGGPFVPARLSDSGAFERQLHRISLARTIVDRLNRTLVAVPVRKPIMGEIDASSGFGVRMDPFLKSPAMHTGLDMRGNTGDPVRATANGTVATAGWNGGYGKMVEIDHGNGLATRYGHLSAIDVEVGQAIKIGQVIGRVGSTGRSTGPHLHYETRVDGEAVDPQKFLRAGIRLGGV
jgi:murein DD-endopeptidase MepM/ murein hydrolase activator NlpD